MSRFRAHALVLFAAAAIVAGRPAAARVDVTLDAASLNDLLRSMAPERVPVELAAGRSVTLVLHDLRVTGFDPAARPAGEVVCAVRLEVPELGLDLPVAPRLALETTRSKGGAPVCVLRFRKVVLNLPLTGAVDVAPLLPVLPVVPDTAWLVHAARGDVRVRPTLVDARTGAKGIRLGFDLQVTPAGK